MQNFCEAFIAPVSESRGDRGCESGLAHSVMSQAAGVSVARPFDGWRAHERWY
jgi:hypothetical protein